MAVAPPKRTALLIAATLMVATTSVGLAQESMSYDNTSRLHASDTLPDVPLRTDLYELATDIDNDGFMNHYRLYSTQHGAYLVTGNERVRERIHELNTLEALAQVENSDAFVAGLKAAGQSTWSNMKTLVTQPVETAEGIPAGVKRFFGNAYRRTKGERRSEYEDSAIKGAVGFSKMKRQVAHRFSVDPYTSNEAMQRALNDVSWAAFAGGMSLSVARTVALPPVVNTPVSVGEVSVKVGSLVRDESPESLQKINIEKLSAIGCSQAAIDSLLTNQWFSPFRESVLAESLYGMENVKNVSAFLPRVASAASEVEAYYMQRNAELLHAYNQHKAPFVELHMPANVPVAETADGGLVAAFAIDYLLWTKELHETVDAVRRDLPERLAGKPIDLWIGGSVDPKAKAALEELGLRVHEAALTALLAPTNKG